MGSLEVKNKRRREENKQQCVAVGMCAKGKPSRKEGKRKQNNVTSLICNMDDNVPSTLTDGSEETTSNE